MSDPLPDWLVKWWHGGDTGLSSRFIAAAYSGSAALLQTTEPAAPRDTSDVGRCVRLLDLALKNGCDWRAAIPMGRLGLLCPAWGPLVDRWDEIEAAYHEDVAAQTAWNRAHPRYRALRGKGKRAEARDAHQPYEHGRLYPDPEFD